MIQDLVNMKEANLGALDLTPFQEPLTFEVNKFGAGYRAVSKIRINYRWQTACEFIESARIFGHKGDLSPEDFKKECITNIADIQEKLLFVFKANHGLLDKESEFVSGMIRFKA